MVAAPQFQARSVGKRGFCSRAGRPRVHLVGSDAQGAVARFGRRLPAAFRACRSRGHGSVS
eukprot:927651-Lingulodinium_polyedra.AAC.1